MSLFVATKLIVKSDTEDPQTGLYVFVHNGSICPEMLNRDRAPPEDCYERAETCRREAYRYLQSSHRMWAGGYLDEDRVLKLPPPAQRRHRAAVKLVEVSKAWSEQAQAWVDLATLLAQEASRG